ncbi:MAG: MotA/TolQ/ExbB proton channel family protein [Treponema sp.]|nr:MotA/TolQ/ExbB proton channel family protein [Treponema sp.]
MIDLLKSGGLLMIPIIICGIAATYIIIERCVYFSSIKKRDAVLLENIADAIIRRDFSAADAFCVSAGTPVAQVIRKAITCRSMQESDMREMVQTKMDSVIPQFEHLLTMLGTIANISTLLGLFGTVTGNIRAFGILGGGGSMGNPAVLAGAIAEALMTTAAGLFVAIPSLVFHNFFVNRVNHAITDMQAHVTATLLRLTGRVA